MDIHPVRDEILDGEVIHKQVILQGTPNVQGYDYPEPIPTSNHYRPLSDYGDPNDYPSPANSYVLGKRRAKNRPFSYAHQGERGRGGDMGRQGEVVEQEENSNPKKRRRD